MNTLPLLEQAAKTASRRIIAAVTSIALGLSLIFVVGFAPISAVHNAAHDTRHSAEFPCH